jgi:hypothetical protein
MADSYTSFSKTLKMVNPVWRSGPRVGTLSLQSFHTRIFRSRKNLWRGSPQRLFSRSARTTLSPPSVLVWSHLHTSAKKRHGCKDNGLIKAHADGVEAGCGSNAPLKLRSFSFALLCFPGWSPNVKRLCVTSHFQMDRFPLEKSIFHEMHLDQESLSQSSEINSACWWPSLVSESKIEIVMSSWILYSVNHNSCQLSFCSFVEGW